MNKQELFKQADYTFQRGNRELAREYILKLLTEYPNEEAGWMLLARIVEEKERKIECYECVVKINPGNNEAKLALARLKSNTQTLPRRVANQNPWQVNRPYKKFLRTAAIVVVILMGLGTTTFAIARNNPESRMGKLLILATPTPFAETLADNIASQTRAEIGAKYPQYASLADTLIAFAVNNAANGMDGAPERPGVKILPSDGIGRDAVSKFKNALPQPGQLSSVTLSEQQVTSWLTMEMKNSPDLPLSDVQVYLQDGKIQIWGMVNGTSTSTSALVVGNLSIDSNNNPHVQIESLQVGKQIIPGVLVSQAEAWLNQLLLEKINEQVPGLKVMNINIGNGLITMSGMR